MNPSFLLVVGDDSAAASTAALFPSAVLHLASTLSAVKRALERSRVDVVLHCSPDVPVRETLSLAANAPHSRPVIVVGDFPDAAAAELLDLGARDCVSAAAPERLKAVVRRAVAVAREERQPWRTDPEARELFESMWKGLPIGLCRIDLEGRIFEVNDAMGAIARCRPEKLIGRTVLDLAAPEDAATTAQLMERLRAGEVQPYAREKSVIRADGAEGWVRVTVFPVGDPRRPSHVISFVQDFTDRRNAERELRRMLCVHQATLDAAADGIAVIGDNGALLTYNARLAELWDLGAGSVPAGTTLGELLSRQLVAPEAFAACLEKASEPADVAPLGVVETRNGRKFEVFSTRPAAAGAGVERVLSFRDVTAPLAAEAALRRSEEHYRLLFESSHDAIIVFDPETELILRANRRAHEIYGYAPGELPGRSLRDMSADVESGRAHIDRLLAGAGSVAFQTVQFRKDRTRIDLDVRATAIPFADRVAILTSNRDITREKAADQALRASEDKYRKLFDRAPVGVAQAAPDGAIVTANRAFAEMLGFAHPAEVLVRTVPEMFADPADHLAMLADLVAGATTLHREVHLRRNDGALIWAEMNVVVERDDEGRFVLAEAYVTDITMRKVAAEERAELSHRISLLLESTYEGICAADLDGVCTLVNPAAARMLGYSPGEIIGKRLHGLIHHSRPDGTPFPADECALRGVVENGKAFVAEDVFWRRDGEALPVEASVSPIVDDGRMRGVVVSFRDIGQRKALERQLELAQQVASLGRVAATIAHEFNNVLMGILPIADLIERLINDDRLRRAAAAMRTSITRGKRITDEILRFARRSQPTLRPTAASKFFADLVVELPAVCGADVELRIERPDDELVLHADAEQLQQVFANLAANARDAMNGGGTLTIIARRERPGTTFPFGAVPDVARFAHFLVSDTGHGMDAETQRRVFEPLFTRKKNGTGIGLAVAHQVLADHGGSIFVESAPGAGTTFHLFVPLVETQRLLPDEPAPAEARSAPHAARTILLVEDDPTVAEGVSTLLTLAGQRVEIVSSGAAAEAAVARLHPAIDVVVLDVGLPDVAGTEVYLRLTSRWPGLPVIFVTGHADPDVLESLGCHDRVVFIRKPFDVDVLTEMIEKVAPASRDDPS